MNYPIDCVRRRYTVDAGFQSVVDLLRSQLVQLRLTPGEVRDAAMLACVLEEERRIPMIRIPVPTKEGR